MNWTTFEHRAKARDRKLRRRRSADMVVSNRSIKSTLLPTIQRKAKAARAKSKEASQRAIDQSYAEQQDPDDGRGTAY